MNTVTVKKDDLLATLTKNREQHRSIFERAQDKYREAMIEELERSLQEAREGRKIRRSFALPEPRDFTNEFDIAIQMVEWEIGDTVELGQQDFARYVLNKWEWAQQFNTNTNSYVGEAWS